MSLFPEATTIDIFNGWQVEELDRQLNIFIDFSRGPGVPSHKLTVLSTKIYKQATLHEQIAINVLRNFPLLIQLVNKLCESNPNINELASIALQIRAGLAKDLKDHYHCRM